MGRRGAPLRCLAAGAILIGVVSQELPPALSLRGSSSSRGASSSKAKKAASQSTSCHCRFHQLQGGRGPKTNCHCDLLDLDLNEEMPRLGFDRCAAFGTCKACSTDELGLAYCARTARRQQVTCARCRPFGTVKPRICSPSVRPFWVDTAANKRAPAPTGADRRRRKSSAGAKTVTGEHLFYRSCGSESGSPPRAAAADDGPANEAASEERGTPPSQTTEISATGSEEAAPSDDARASDPEPEEALPPSSDPEPQTSNEGSIEEPSPGDDNGQGEPARKAREDSHDSEGINDSEGERGSEGSNGAGDVGHSNEDNHDSGNNNRGADDSNGDAINEGSKDETSKDDSAWPSDGGEGSDEGQDAGVTDQGSPNHGDDEGDEGDVNNEDGDVPEDPEGDDGAQTHTQNKDDQPATSRIPLANETALSARRSQRANSVGRARRRPTAKRPEHIDESMELMCFAFLNLVVLVISLASLKRQQRTLLERTMARLNDAGPVTEAPGQAKSAEREKSRAMSLNSEAMRSPIPIGRGSIEAVTAAMANISGADQKMK